MVLWSLGGQEVAPLWAVCLCRVPSGEILSIFMLLLKLLGVFVLCCCSLHWPGFSGDHSAFVTFTHFIIHSFLSICSATDLYIRECLIIVTLTVTLFDLSMTQTPLIGRTEASNEALHRVHYM